MEGNELYNFSISPVVNSPFALEWSEDNHVSLITQSGIHVFEFVPHPTCIYPTLRFWRTFIHAPSFSPVEAYSQFINKELWGMTREEIYTLLLEESITSGAEDRVPQIPRITRIAWSPKNLAEPCRCLAAIVTSAGSIEILKKYGDEWFSVWNLTEKWCRRVEKEENVDPATATTESFSAISWPQHIKRLIGTAITWSSLCGSAEPYAYLAAAFGGSEIVVARVEKMSDALRTEEPRIVYASSLKSAAKISQLAWIAAGDKKLHTIMIGYADGRIHGLGAMETDGKLVDEKLWKYQDRADRMAITSFRCVRSEDGNAIVLATKASCLVAISLNCDGELLGTRYLKLPAFSITGATILSQKKILLTAQNAKIYVANIPESGDLTQIPLEHDMKTSKVQYFGITASPNRALLLNVTSPNTLYDHLTLREPSNVQIFSLKAAADHDLSSMIIERYEKNVPLADYWDCVEASRIMAAKSDEASKIMPATIPTDLDGLSVDKLRLIMWLTIITEILDKKQLLKGVDKIIGEISEAQPLIFLTSACNHLERLSRKKHLDSDEKRSVCFLRMFMEIYLAGEETEENSMTRKITRIFRDTRHVPAIETEDCNLCGDILSDLPWTIAACPNGHKLPRCSVSLLQITSVRYRSCKICERLFHPSLDKEYEIVRCIYCDLPADYDSRVTTYGAVSDQWKNLSKRPPCHNQSEMARNPDAETSASTGETTKHRGLNKPKTFAVVVNRDEDDDPLITETWQKF